MSLEDLAKTKSMTQDQLAEAELREEEELEAKQE